MEMKKLRFGFRTLDSVSGLTIHAIGRREESIMKVAALLITLLTTSDWFMLFSH